MTNINRAAVLAHFSGKSFQNAIAALDNLEASIEAGEWVPGSRTAKAALNKSNLAAKAAKALGEVHKGVSYKDPARDHVFSMWMALTYGQYTRLDRIDLPLVLASTDKDVLKLAKLYVAYSDAFAPIGEAIQALDNAIPKPVFTAMGASPTVTKIIEALGVVKVDVCPIEWIKGSYTNKKGETITYRIGVLKWPTGTKHGTSRFTMNACQCEACGHGIRNPFNWIPLVLTAGDGTPKALWVGRDCAQTLFGIKMTGDLVLNEGPGAKKMEG